MWHTSLACFFLLHPTSGGLAEYPSQQEAWHNTPVYHARVGVARAWTREFDRDAMNSKVRHGWALIPAGRLFLVNVKGTLYAIDTATGKTRWTRSDRIGDVLIGESKAILIDRLVVLPIWNGDRKTSIFALDSNSGKLVWQKSVEGWCPNIQVVKNDLIVERLQFGPSSENKPIGMSIIDGLTGATRGTLSPTDVTANRQTLAKVCPSILDQFILYGYRITQNGIYLKGDVPGVFIPRSCIVGDALYTHSTVEDFPIDGFTADCGLRKLLLNDLNGADSWQGKGMGKNYNNAACVHFGEVVGPFKGRVLTTFTKKDGSSNSKPITSLGTLPMEGLPVFEPIFGLGPKVNGIPWERTSVGYVIHGWDQTKTTKDD